MASLGLSLWRWQAAPGRLKVKTTSATRRGRDEEGRSRGSDGGRKLCPEPVPEAAPALNQAEAALLPPAAHLIMVVC